MFGVPGSKRSGRKSGTSSVWEILPVPPLKSGSILEASSLRIRKPPIPCGPRSPLCPVKASASSFNSSISIGSVPAVCALSRTKSSPCFWQKVLISLSGMMVPHTLEAWRQTRSLVFGFTSESASERIRFPSRSQGILSKVTPCF